MHIFYYEAYQIKRTKFSYRWNFKSPTLSVSTTKIKVDFAALSSAATDPQNWN